MALPAIRADLDFSVQSLQWVPSAYLLTYGGLMLIGGALGLAIFSAVATSRTSGLIADRTPVPEAVTAGFSRALLVGSISLAAAAVVALRAANSRGEAQEAPADRARRHATPGPGLGTLRRP